MPPFSSIKRSIRRRRRKLANRKKRASNPAARKRNRRKRLRPEHRVLPCGQADILSAEFALYFLRRVTNRLGAQTEKVCVLFCGNEYFIRLSSLLVAAAVTGGSYNAFGKALRFHFRDGDFPSAE